jgi:hypothetical protein
MVARWLARIRVTEAARPRLAIESMASSASLPQRETNSACSSMTTTKAGLAGEGASSRRPRRPNSLMRVSRTATAACSS